MDDPRIVKFRLEKIRRHKCGKFCFCPIHKTPLIYSPYINQHACQNIKCVHAHGMVKNG